MTDTTWIYHERQEALLCGQHALNNLVQSQTFSPQNLSEIALQLDQIELNYMSQNNEGGIHSRDFRSRLAEGSGNVDESGNFSIEVLRSALLNQYNLTLVNVLQESIRNQEITEFEGFICNRESHWFSIRKINTRFWNLNSTAERPELISHFRLAAELQALQEHGYSVFCVAEIGALPPVCKSDAERDERGLLKFWWKEADLIQGRTETAQGTKDPWSNVGNGMRLDGRSTSATNNASGASSLNVEGLTEEEMIKIAMEASMQPDQDQLERLEESVVTATLKPEPALGEEGTVTIQFRLPSGKRQKRRFYKTELVDVLFIFVNDTCPSDGKSLQMRAGYPSQDLKLARGKTIEETGLSGEMIQCRHV